MSITIGWPRIGIWDDVRATHVDSAHRRAEWRPGQMRMARLIPMHAMKDPDARPGDPGAGKESPRNDATNAFVAWLELSPCVSSLQYRDVPHG